MSDPNTRGDHAPAVFLGWLENNFPDPGLASNPEGKPASASFRTDARALHKAKYPELYPTEPPPPPPPPPGGALLEFDVYVPGGAGPVRGGIPIHVGGLQVNPARCLLGTVEGACRVEATYADGKPRWLRVVLPAAAPAGWEKLRLFADGSPLQPIAMVSVPAGVIRADTWDESPTGLAWRSWTNETPTGTHSSGAQPTCLNFGTPEDRVASIDGAPIVLRAGERVGKFPTFRPIWCATSWYRRCEGQAFLGVIARVDPRGTSLRAKFLNESIKGLVQAALSDGLKPTLEPLRDLGDMNRDWEGPSDAIKKWNCNEGGPTDGLWKCFAQQVGEPSGQPSPMCASLWSAIVAMARHHATVDIYHVEAGPLPWMWGAWLQHEEHGGSGEGNPHRGMAPNTAHFNSEGVSIVRYLAADPVIADGMERLQRRTLWKVENGPGMPGIPSIAGEERATANLMRILLEGRLDQPADFARYNAAINRVIAEGVAQRFYVTGVGVSKIKPWMAAVLARELESAEAAGFTAATAPLAKMRDHFAADWWHENDRPSGKYPTAYYQRNPDITEFEGFKNLLVADVIRDSHPAIAARLYASGEKAPWYVDQPLEWIRVLSACGVVNFGHQYDAKNA